jgi:pimeloyl-ACP methyl ester carboxylesterase
MVPYMMKWIAIFTQRRIIIDCLPKWYFYYAAFRGLQNLERERRCVFAPLEKVIRRIAPRPLLMIHGSADNYIKPEMAESLFKMARAPKEFWLVDGAKHNQAITLAESEYKRRLLAFFFEHLADKKTTPFHAAPSANGIVKKKERETIR